MIDLSYLRLIAGNGGDGRVSLYRAKGITKGGPNGGNGGSGGKIILEASRSHNTLQHLAGLKEIIAPSGDKGGKFDKTGADGEDIVIKVPLGTVVWLVAENQASKKRRLRTGLSRLLKKDEARFDKFFIEKEGQAPPPAPDDQLSFIPAKITDYLDSRLTDPEALYQPLPEDHLLQLISFETEGQQFILCQGGFGGRGNDAFKSSTHQTPLEAEYGTTGEQKLVFLEARSLADIGLIGLPNAGKSSLLSRLTDKQPKIANYPFTTLEPNLGVINFSQNTAASRQETQSAVIADIPGLIEGASEGKGLGFSFLRHVENCRLLLQVVSLEENLIFDQSLAPDDKAQALLSQVKIIRQELADYHSGLTDKPFALLINKCDLFETKLAQLLLETLQKSYPDQTVLLVSAATGEGLAELKQLCHKLLNANPVSAS